MLFSVDFNPTNHEMPEQRSVLLVTTILDARGAATNELDGIYRNQWNIEVDLR